MNIRMLFVLLLVACFACALPAPALAQVTNFTNAVPSDQSWFTDGNWDNGKPNANKDAVILTSAGTAIIPANRTDAAARTITIQSGAKVRIRNAARLTLGDGGATRRVSTFESGSLLEIGKTAQGGVSEVWISGTDHVFKGNGGVVTFQQDSIIDHDAVGADDDHLRLEGSCTGAPARSCSLMINGQGSIKVALFNDAYVVGTGMDVGATVTLADHGKDSGSNGSWIAEDGGGLSVQSVVQGSGAWLGQSATNQGGRITIGAPGAPGCVVSSGDVTLTGFAATLDVTPDGGFCTTGEALIQSQLVQDTPTNPTVSVAAGRVAQFHLASCTLAACP